MDLEAFLKQDTRNLDSSKLIEYLDVLETLIVQTNLPQLYLVRFNALLQAGRYENAINALGHLVFNFPGESCTKSIIDQLSSIRTASHAIPEKSVDILVEDSLLLSTDPDQQIEIINPYMFEVPAPEKTPRLLKIRNAQLLGSYGIVRTVNGAFIKDTILYEDIQKELTEFNLLDQPFRHLQGEYLSLYGMWNEGFWHWMTEALPTVILAEQSGFKGTYIIPKGADFISESMLMLGVSSSRIMIHSGDSYRVDQLFVFSRYSGVYLSEMKGLTHELRERLIFSALQSGPAKDYRRIFINRKNSNRPRKLINYSEIKPILDMYEFQEIDMQKISLCEQIRAVVNCEFLIGPHGAGMFHSIFIKPKSKIIEFFPPSYINYTILPAIELLNHHYYMMVAGIRTTPDNLSEDILVTPQMLERTLRVEVGA